MYDSGSLYDLNAALATANAGPKDIGTPRSHDRLLGGRVRPSELPSIVGLLEGSYCRRCEARFTHADFDRHEHRAWHEWLDERGRHDELTDVLRGYFDGCELPAPTVAQLQKHREKFEPQGVTFRHERTAHGKAVDDVARVYHGKPDDRLAQAKELWDDNWPISEIAKETGLTTHKLRKHLEAA